MLIPHDQQVTLDESSQMLLWRMKISEGRHKKQSQDVSKKSKKGGIRQCPALLGISVCLCIHCQLFPRWKFGA